MPFKVRLDILYVKKTVYVTSHNYAIIKIESYDVLAPEKTLTLPDLIITIKSVLIMIKITITIIYFQKNV